MPIRHTDKGWFWGSKGPFDTKAKALAVGRAAYASGYREAESKLVAIDYDGTYDLHPELWDNIIELMLKEGWQVKCVTQRADTPEDLEKVHSTIGKTIGEQNCIFTSGQDNKQFLENMGIDVWIAKN